MLTYINLKCESDRIRCEILVTLVDRYCRISRPRRPRQNVFSVWFYAYSATRAIFSIIVVVFFICCLTSCIFFSSRLHVVDNFLNENSFNYSKNLQPVWKFTMFEFFFRFVNWPFLFFFPKQTSGYIFDKRVVSSRNT